MNLPYLDIVTLSIKAFSKITLNHINKVNQMSDSYKKYLAITIGLAFLVYGGIRLGVSSLLLLQTLDFLAIPNLQEGVDEVVKFLVKVREQALFPLSALGYIIYLWVMGLFLVIGAIGCLKRKQFAQTSISAFLVLYVALFINFQTINPKVFHLIVCALLLLLYKFFVESKINKVKET